MMRISGLALVPLPHAGGYAVGVMVMHAQSGLALVPLMRAWASME